MLLFVSHIIKIGWKKNETFKKSIHSELPICHFLFTMIVCDFSWMCSLGSMESIRWERHENERSGKNRRMKNKTIVRFFVVVVEFILLGLNLWSVCCALVYTRAEPHISFWVHIPFVYITLLYIFRNINKWLGVCACVFILYIRILVVRVSLHNIVDTTCPQSAIQLKIESIDLQTQTCVGTHAHTRNRPKYRLANANKKAHAQRDTCVWWHECECEIQ